MLFTTGSMSTTRSLSHSMQLSLHACKQPHWAAINRLLMHISLSRGEEATHAADQAGITVQYPGCMHARCAKAPRNRHSLPPDTLNCLARKCHPPAKTLMGVSPRQQNKTAKIGPAAPRLKLFQTCSSPQCQSRQIIRHGWFCWVADMLGKARIVELLSKQHPHVWHHSPTVWAGCNTAQVVVVLEAFSQPHSSCMFCQHNPCQSYPLQELTP